MLQTVQWAIVEAGDVDGQDQEVLGGARQVRGQRLSFCWDQRSQTRLQACGRLDSSNQWDMMGILLHIKLFPELSEML